LLHIYIRVFINVFLVTVRNCRFAFYYLPMSTVVEDIIDFSTFRRKKTALQSTNLKKELTRIRSSKVEPLGTASKSENFEVWFPKILKFCSSRWHRLLSSCQGHEGAGWNRDFPDRLQLIRLNHCISNKFSLITIGFSDMLIRAFSSLGHLFHRKNVLFLRKRFIMFLVLIISKREVIFFDQTGHTFLQTCVLKQGAHWLQNQISS